MQPSCSWPSCTRSSNARCRAALAAAVNFTAGFQIYAWWKLGYMDPFWPIAVVVSGGVSFAVGLAALVALRHLVERPRGKHDH